MYWNSNTNFNIWAYILICIDIEGLLYKVWALQYSFGKKKTFLSCSISLYYANPVSRQKCDSIVTFRVEFWRNS